MKVIAICGTNGSGKGTVAEYLLSLPSLKDKLTYVRARDLIVAKAKEAGISLENRPDFTNFTEKLYANGGSLWSEFLKENKDTDKFYILESIRRVREINNIRDICPDSLIISVDAGSKLRYERIVKRSTETDHVSYEKFMEEEARESEGVLDTVMNIPKCIEMSDIKLTNNGVLDKFKQNIEEKVLKNQIFTGVI